LRHSIQVLEEKGLRRSIQDASQKIIDVCVGLAMKTNSEPITWDSGEEQGKTKIFHFILIHLIFFFD
jgi:hypothetical protein